MNGQNAANRIYAADMRERKGISVCFTGHRHIPPEDREWLTLLVDRQIEALYREGYRDFLCGGALGFDTLAAQRVCAARVEHSDIRLRLVLPCADQSKFWTKLQCDEYERLLYMAERIDTLQKEYTPGCMHQRNRFLVDSSSVCVAYLKKKEGGTYYTAMYARKQGTRLIILDKPGENRNQ